MAQAELALQTYIGSSTCAAAGSIKRHALVGGHAVRSCVGQLGVRMAAAAMSLGAPRATGVNVLHRRRSVRYPYPRSAAGRDGTADATPQRIGFDATR